eukprot:TRINITY_DN10307_c0_g1_i2.p2 TRINITY_DN10307_c0_g1~~TRINITY_DN10307_c0_g1_i2.p2  ORF type:complete len:208 (+),score=37.51 TRINITY_DN10307_c0_g1_i2:113-736(+)
MQKLIQMRKQSFWIQLMDYSTELASNLLIFANGRPNAIQKEVDKSFSQQEFLEGAKEAYQVVIDKFNESDWEDLEDLVSHRVLKELKQAKQSVVNVNLNHQISVNHPMTAQFCGMLPAATLRIENAEEIYKDWLLVGVRFNVEYNYQIVQNEKIVLNSKDNYWDIWIFGRGPLPSNLPADDLDCPWSVVDILQFPIDVLDEEDQQNS